MKKTRTDEQNVVMLRRAGVLAPRDSSTADAIRPIMPGKFAESDRRQDDGRSTTESINRLINLEQENARLRRIISDLTLDTLTLKKAVGRNS